MSLRDEGGEEECFEYDGQDEERELAPAQQDTLDLAEEGKFLLCPIDRVLLLSVSRWAGCFTELTALFPFLIEL